MLDVSALTPDTQAAYRKLREFSDKNGILPGFSLAETLRTCARQNELFAQGPSVTRARGCMSWHVMGRAFDVSAAGLTCDDLRPLGAFWESMGGIWGGRWSDCVHFEWHPGYRVEQLCHDPESCRYSPMPPRYPGGVSSGGFLAAAAVTVGLAAGGWYVWKNRKVLSSRQR